jgi:hypothetical protein
MNTKAQQPEECQSFFAKISPLYANGQTQGQDDFVFAELLLNGPALGVKELGDMLSDRRLKVDEALED